MPRLSDRGIKVPDSPIRKLVPFAEAAKRRGKKIYHLNIGQPDIETPPLAMQAVKDADIDILSYSPSAGFESYRKKLVGYYQNYGIELDYSEILVTTGASEAILFTMLSCLESGDEVIVPEPFYANYHSFAIASGIKVKSITSYIETGFALPPITDFEAVVTPATKAILICNPSNPTGYLYSKAELEELKKIVLKHDLFLIVDEVYREFVYDGKKHESVLTLDGLDDHVIVIDSISKRFSACGARIGSILSRNKAFIGNVLKFARARLSPPTFAQILAEATLDVPANYLSNAVAEYDKRRKVLTARLNQMEGVTCPIPGGAFYTFVEMPIDDSDKFCRWMLEEFDLDGETIMMAPGNGFYLDKNLGANQVRLAYVLNVEDLERALTVLEAGLKAYQKLIMDNC